ELAVLRWRTRWLEPAITATSDERWVPSDSVRVGARTREVTTELASPGRLPWHGVAGFGWRRDGVASDPGFTDVTESRTTRLALDSPSAGRLGGSLSAARRDQRAPLTN